VRRHSPCTPGGALFRVLLLLFVCCAASGVRATALEAQLPDFQPGETLWEVRLADGSLAVGRVVAASAGRITIETANGTRLDVARDQIRSAREAEGRVVGGDYWFEDPNHTRLSLISPTGRSLRHGEGYVSSFWVVFPFVAYGVTDHFTIAGGTPIVPGLIGRVLYVAPKLRVAGSEGANFSVGALSFFMTEEATSGTAGIAYGVGTWGSTDGSLTAGAGWAYAFGDGKSWASNRPAILLGGDTRISRSAKLVTENFFVPGESGTLLSGAIRLFGERLAVDFGIAGFVSDSDFEWFPAANFVYNFGRR
jgi:hypothetical protein